MLKLQKNFNDTQNLSSLKSCTNFCFPNGKLPYPEKFTKITKVPLTDLRFWKVVVSGYIDDFFTKDHSSEGCFKYAVSMAELFDRIGFFVHRDKFLLISTQEITMLGFVIN